MNTYIIRKESDIMKERIINSLNNMRMRNEALAKALTDTANLTDYKHLTFTDDEGRIIWSDAFDAAIRERERLEIPDGEYFVNRTIVIPSCRMIYASTEAHIKKTPLMNTLLVRNESVMDGTHFPIPKGAEDKNITIVGGVWEDTNENDIGYHGLYDANDSMVGINSCFFFDNMVGLNIDGVKIIRAGGFGVQVGNLTDAVIENVEFVRTLADGVHINGNTKNIIVRNISGTVADDIVAFNMYDWQRSSVCFGPIENALCENITLYPEARYKAIRVLPGLYYYDDNSTVRCDINDVIIRNVRGVNTFKFYFQTPPYSVDAAREKGDPGHGGNIFIEDVKIKLDAPIDAFDEYMNADPVLGSFAAFEFGSYFGKVTLKDIDIEIDKSLHPMAFLATIGPKSIRRDEYEIFDPELSSEIDELVLDGVKINSTPLDDDMLNDYVHEIKFEALYGDKNLTSSGKFKSITVI